MEAIKLGAHRNNVTTIQRINVLLKDRSLTYYHPIAYQCMANQIQLLWDRIPLDFEPRFKKLEKRVIKGIDGDSSESLNELKNEFKELSESYSQCVKNARIASDAFLMQSTGNVEANCLQGCLKESMATLVKAEEKIKQIGNLLDSYEQTKDLIRMF